MRMLFVGDNWQGARPRSLREAFGRRDDVLVADVVVDHRMPRREALPTRVLQRLVSKIEVAAVRREVLRQGDDFRPDVVVFYKGWHFDAEFIRDVRRRFGPVVNIFPDCSPHAHGGRLAEAIGVYDLVVTTKTFQPPAWRSTYGYTNKCVFVPHGYDPALHYRREVSRDHDYDVVLVAAGRPEYFELVRGLARLPRLKNVKVAIVGNDWGPVSGDLPVAWALLPSKFGVSYVDWLRRGRVVIAPVQRRMVVGGLAQPGEQDSARTYEIPAAYCFFVHRRTELLGKVFDEATEAPLYDDAADLADKILHYLDHEDERLAAASAAHARAVPAYSFDARATEIKTWLDTL